MSQKINKIPIRDINNKGFESKIQKNKIFNGQISHSHALIAEVK